MFKNVSRWNVESAGTATSAKRKVSGSLLVWADIIYVIEKRHKEILFSKFDQEMKAKDVVVLDIPDEYKYNDPELISILQDEVLGLERS